MKLKGYLVVVKDCQASFEFYHQMFGLELIHDYDGNMELAGGLYLQEESYWEQFINHKSKEKHNRAELYFEESDIDKFVEKLKKLYPGTEFVSPIMTHDWGQTVVRFYDPDGNLIEVGTPV